MGGRRQPQHRGERGQYLVRYNLRCSPQREKGRYAPASYEKRNRFPRRSVYPVRIIVGVVGGYSDGVFIFFRHSPYLAKYFAVKISPGGTKQIRPT